MYDLGLPEAARVWRATAMLILSVKGSSEYFFCCRALLLFAFAVSAIVSSSCTTVYHIPLFSSIVWFLFAIVHNFFLNANI